MKRLIALFLAIAAVGAVAGATTATTATASNKLDAQTFAHGAAIAAGNYARKQLDIDIPWYRWKTNCELGKKDRARCTTETLKIGSECEGMQCRGQDEADCSGSLRVRERKFKGGVDAYDRRISCKGISG